MRYFSLFALVVLATVCHAQESDRFRIGVGDVGPEYNLADHKLYPVRGVVSVDTTLARTALADSIRYHYLTQKQFALVRELGLDLISVLIDPDAVRRDTIPTNRNPVAEVSAAAISGTDTIDLIIRDWVAEDNLHGERLMFHPEAATDFVAQGGYTPATRSDFNRLPIYGMELSTPLSAHGEGQNAILMEPGNSSVSGLQSERKLEISRGSDTTVSGLYLVSVTVMDDGLPPHPPNSSDTVLTVEIVSRDTLNPSSTRTTILPLLGRQFYSGGALRTGAFEAVIGAIEVRYDILAGGDTVLHVQQRDPLNPAWEDTTSFKATKVLATDSGFTEIDVRISYGSGSCKFYLDAVCMTSPTAFAL